MKPHAAGIDAFTSGELKKSFMSHSLNKTRTITGGGSGYRSESRKPLVGDSKYKSVGDIPPSKVVKTTIHYIKTVRKEEPGQLGEIQYEKIKKSISKSGYIPKGAAFTTVPYTYMVVYEDRLGAKMTVTNTNIK